MDLLKLEIENFLTITGAELELDSRGLLLIQGINQADTSTRSNGSGKSSIVDAVCWCDYGTTARDVSGDEVVNDIAKKNCRVATLWKDGDTRYLVERYRKHSKHKNALYVWQLGDGTNIPLHKGTERETQAVIEKIMGCSHAVFVGSIYAGQEQMPDLPGMTDKHLKLLVEEAAGTEELAACYKEACAEVTVAERMLAVAQTNHQHAQRDEVNAATQLAQADDQCGLFEAGRKDRAREELAKISPMSAQMQALRIERDAIDVAALTTRRAALQAVLTGHNERQDKLQGLVQAAANASRGELLAKQRLLNAKQKFEAAKQDLVNVEAMVGKPCGECGKGYCEHDVEGVKVLRQTDIEAAKTAQDALIKPAKDAVKVAAAAQKVADDFLAGMPDVSATSTELKEVTQRLTNHTLIEKQIDGIEAAIKSRKDLAKEKMLEPNPWIEERKRRAVAHQQAQELVQKCQAGLTTIQAELDLWADSAKVFGPAGVRAHILDSVTPFLNAQTNEYLGALSDGNITATWNTLSTSAKGELKEKFNIAVTNDQGGSTFKLQSGGEKRKVRVACALALQDMVASRATKPINLFLADEIDDALDSPGLERLMGILEKKARDRGTVMIISHNSLADWCDQILTVTKTARGQSTVGGAAMRT